MPDPSPPDAVLGSDLPPGADAGRAASADPTASQDGSVRPVAPAQPGQVDAPDAPTDGRAGRDASAGARSAHTVAVAGLVLAIAVAAVLTCTVLIETAWLPEFDASVSTAVLDWADAWGWPVQVAARVGAITEPLWSALVASLLVIALAALRFRAAAGFLAGSAALGLILVTSTKLLVGRQRPDGAEGHDVHMYASFPSGHAAAGIYLDLAAGVILLRIGSANGWRATAWLGRVLIVIGPLIGLTRIALGVHWPSDVLAGWAFGWIALLTSALLFWDRLAQGWVQPSAEQQSDS